MSEQGSGGNVSQGLQCATPSCNTTCASSHAHKPALHLPPSHATVTLEFVVPQVRTLAQLLEMVDQERQLFHGMKLDHVRATAKRNLRQLWMGSASTFHNNYKKQISDLSKQEFDPSVPKVRHCTYASYGLYGTARDARVSERGHA